MKDSIKGLDWVAHYKNVKKSNKMVEHLWGHIEASNLSHIPFDKLYDKLIVYAEISPYTYYPKFINKRHMTITINSSGRARNVFIIKDNTYNII